MDGGYWYTVYNVRNLATPWLLWFCALFSFFVAMGMFASWIKAGSRYSTPLVWLSEREAAIHDGDGKRLASIEYVIAKEKRGFDAIPLLAIAGILLSLGFLFKGYNYYNDSGPVHRRNAFLFEGVLSNVKISSEDTAYVTIGGEWLLWPLSTQHGCRPVIGDQVRIWYSPELQAPPFTSSEFSGALLILKLQMKRNC